MDVPEYNRDAWDRQVEDGNQWTVPVGPEVIEVARQGQWEVFLTDQKYVPRAWFPEMAGADVLCLASGGGQQAPIFAAAGANVTVLDNSPKQLAQDRFVAERESLDLKTVQGDMRDLSAFADENFDLVFHPVSNLFVPEVRPVWKEAFRVLRRGGSLLAGFLNPVVYIFDLELADDTGEIRVRYSLPYSDATSRTEEELGQQMESREPLEFSHTLEEQIGGQIEAGFLISGFYEDRHRDDPIAAFMPTFVATRAIKP
jgi:ubiquinone/menaquinone biosynthesis C-methylase UbiE